MFHGNILVHEVIKTTITKPLRSNYRFVGVVGTPTFFINGVFVDATSSWSLKDWQSVIDPILASNGIDIAANKTCPAGQTTCTFAPERVECCLQGERCIPNVGCRCFNLKNGNQCRSQ